MYVIRLLLVELKVCISSIWFKYEYRLLASSNFWLDLCVHNSTLNDNLINSSKSHIICLHYLFSFEQDTLFILDSIAVTAIPSQIEQSRGIINLFQALSIFFQHSHMCHGGFPFPKTRQNRCGRSLILVQLIFT